MFFASGAAGLVYEVAWSKRLELTFGTTSQSIATVLAAYMAGLGLGAWWLGRLADRPGSPARRYAALEALIGAYGLCSPWILDGIDAVYVALGGAGGVALKAALGLLVLLPPTILMGGTLPVLARGLVKDPRDTQRAVGLLYGLNTVGAVVGACLSGLWFLETFGIDATCRATGAFNLALAALAWALGTQLSPDVTASDVTASDEQAEPAPAPTAATPAADPAFLLRVGLIGTLSFGALALALEVAWTRALGLAFSSSGDGFTIVLAATLLGIGLGSLIAGAVRTEDPRAPLVGLFVAALLLAASNYALLIGFDTLPGVFHTIAQSRFFYYESLLAVLFGLSALCLLPATLALGIAFPLCSQLGSPRAETSGQSVGLLYLANTGGAILGSLLGGFVLLPLLGSEGLIRAGAVLAAGGAIAVAWALHQSGQWSPASLRPPALLAGTLALAALLQPGWSPLAFDVDPLRLSAELTPEPGHYQARLQSAGRRLAYAREGLNAFVTVREEGPLLSLRIGGKPDASTASQDMPTQLLLGILGPLARPQGQDVLVVGVGSGITARAAADCPAVTAVDVVELEPAMIEAASTCFKAANDGVLERDDVRVILDDARSWLSARADKSYDVITSEPSNPSIAGVANLFTAQHYQNAKRRLKPGGVYVQWIQLYASDDPMALAMLGTFVDAFAHVQAWWATPNDMLLLGSDEPLAYDLTQAEQVLAQNARLVPELEPYFRVHRPLELFGHFLLEKPELASITRRAERLDDDLPRLEGWAARARYEGIGNSALLNELWGRVLNRAQPWPPTTEPPPGELDLFLERAEHLESISLAMARQALERSRSRNEAGDSPERAVMELRLLPGSEPALTRVAAARERWPQSQRLQLEQARIQIDGGRFAAAAQTVAPLCELAELQAPLDPAMPWLLRSQTFDPTHPQGAAQTVAAVRRAWALLRDGPTLREQRVLLLSRLIQASPREPEAIQYLLELREAWPYETAVRLSLAEALLLRGQLEPALVEVDNTLDVQQAHYLAGARLLRLRILGASNALSLSAELARFLRDFPSQAGDPEVQALIRKVRHG